MEALLYMKLCLPNHYGGYALGGAKFNYEIDIDGKQSLLRSKLLRVDLYWDKAKLIVEYDSDKHHSSKSQRDRDARRRLILESLGYEVISVNTNLIYSIKAFDEVAHEIARKLGKRISIRDPIFSKAQEHLHELLPRQEQDYRANFIDD
jgi:very-short-patch-repair endonuclease